MKVLALDIGGSSVKWALFDVLSNTVTRVSEVATIPFSSQRFDELRSIVEGIVFANKPETGWVGISTTGAVSPGGIVLNAGHFEGYRNIDWHESLREAGFLGRVATINDGRAVALAEYNTNGPCECLLSVVVGTGVGAGVVVSGEPWFGDDGWAGGLGHMKVPSAPKSLVCSCGRTGCVETGAAGPAIARHWEKASDFSQVLAAARRGDPAALSAFAAGGAVLGEAIANMMNLMNPRVITVGGGVLVATAGLGSVSGVYFDAVLERAYGLAYSGLETRTRILPSSFGNHGGLVGAAVVVARGA